MTSHNGPECKHTCSFCFNEYDCERRPQDCREGGKWGVCEACLEEMSRNHGWRVETEEREEVGR